MLSSKSSVKSLTLLCVVTYFISYITRINYGAVIVDINKNTGIAQTALALAPTLSFITYGIGQLVSGFLGDKIQPKLLVFCGLIVTTLMNFFLPFCTTAGAMSAFWAVNGLAQAFMWPPIAKLMLSSMDGDEYKKQIQKVLWGSMVATMFVYLISPLIVSVMNWKGVFWFSAITGALGIVYWLKACPIIALKGKEEKENLEKTERNNTPIIAVMAVLLFAIICMGALRDGVTTWLPSYVSEAFNLESESAILTGAVLPMFTMVCYSVTARLYKTKLKNPVLCAGVVFGLGFLASLVLYILTATSSSGIVASVTLAALLTGCMHGVNLILISMLPSYFKRRGKVSLITGILNCAVYVGSAISTYLFPLVAEGSSWNAIILIWVIIASIGTLVCALMVIPWKKVEKSL